MFLLHKETTDLRKMELDIMVCNDRAPSLCVTGTRREWILFNKYISLIDKNNVSTQNFGKLSYLYCQICYFILLFW